MEEEIKLNTMLPGAVKNENSRRTLLRSAKNSMRHKRGLVKVSAHFSKHLLKLLQHISLRGCL